MSDLNHVVIDNDTVTPTPKPTPPVVPTPEPSPAPAPVGLDVTAEQVQKFMAVAIRLGRTAAKLTRNTDVDDKFVDFLDQFVDEPEFAEVAVLVYNLFRTKGKSGVKQVLAAAAKAAK